MAMPAAFSLTNAPDIHLFFMAAIVFMAGIAGVGSVVVLLLLAPLAKLALGRSRPLRGVTASVDEVKEQKPDGGAARLSPRPTDRGEA